MLAHRRLAFALLDALIREDSNALDTITREIEAHNLSTPVLCTVSALFTSALIGVHGEAGALALLDQAEAEHRAGWSA